ncbi:cytochrome B [Asaia sp. W19]|nr:cytochrome B [Asaia sp. W19]
MGGMRDRSGMKSRYDLVAMGLHWLMALGILALIAIGLAMVHGGLPPGTMFRLFQLHKSIGITILLAALCRLAWRLAHRPPVFVGTMPRMERHLAALAHAVLYAAMILLPLSGWAVVSSSVYAIPTVLYGLIPWPDLPYLPHLANKQPVEDAFSALHSYGAYGFIALITLHVLAALRHQLILKDGVLERMLPQLGKKDR